MTMILSTTTFSQDPGQMTILRADKLCSYQKTISNVVYFSWGSTIVGKVIDLGWNAMPSTMFDALDAVYATDTTCIWSPNLPGSTQTYEVNVLDLKGDYYISQESSSNYYRINCSLSLLIMSEVT